MAFGDFDGNGLEDVVVANADVEAFQFTARGRTRLQIIPSPFRDASGFVLAAADLNADSYADLIVGNTQSGLDLFFGSCDGLRRRADAVLPVLSADAIHTVTAADIDGDGETDILVGTGGYNFLARGSTTGFHRVELAFNDAGRRDSHAFLVFDADGDGDRDVLVGNGGGDDLYLATGAGNFALTSATGDAAADAPTDFFLADDVDADGVVDVIAGSHRVYVKAATGFLTTAMALAQPYYGSPAPVVSGPSLFLIACVLLLFTVFRLRRRAVARPTH